MEEFEICLEKTYWKYVKVKAETYSEAKNTVLQNCEEPPKYFGDWSDYNNSIVVAD